MFSFSRMILAALLAVVWAQGAVAGIPSKGGASGRPRVALVIGNSAYINAPLPNPANDTRLISSTLTSLGFDVVEHIDTTRRQMKRAVAEFEERLLKAGANAVGLFYVCLAWC